MSPPVFACHRSCEVSLSLSESLLERSLARLTEVERAMHMPSPNLQSSAALSAPPSTFLDTHRDRMVHSTRGGWFKLSEQTSRIRVGAETEAAGRRFGTVLRRSASCGLHWAPRSERARNPAKFPVAGTCNKDFGGEGMRRISPCIDAKRIWEGWKQLDRRQFRLPNVGTESWQQRRRPLVTGQRLSGIRSPALPGSSAVQRIAEGTSTPFHA